MDNNYLKTTQRMVGDGKLDYCTTSNYDEEYIKYLPRLSPRKIFELVTNYPSDEYSALISALKSKFNFDSSPIIGAGSEELIVRINEILKNKGMKVGVVTPTFYRITESLNKFVSIPFNRFIDWDCTNLDVVWLVNPNTLNGQVLLKKDISMLMKKFPNTVFIVDESAVILVDKSGTSLLSDCHKFRNLVVLGSLSKFFGLPGLRVGFALGNNDLLDTVKKSLLTFPTSNLTSYIVQNAISQQAMLRHVQNRIVKHKKQIEAVLSRHPNIEVTQSFTNCVFCHFTDHRNLYSKLLEIGIVGLDLNTQVGTEKKGLVRLTIHSSKQKHAILLSKLKSFVNNEEKN